MIVYVRTQGARILREGRHLIVRTPGSNDTRTLFTYRLSQVVVVGNVTITPQALKLLLREAIDTVFLRTDGRYIGRLEAPEPKNVFLRKKQFALLDDRDFCLKMAKSIVAGKTANMATVLQRIQRTRKEPKAGDAAAEIRRVVHRLPVAESVEEVRGLEGYAAARYFPAFALGLDSDFGFRRRVRRPPTDPVNAVLSLLYTFLINRANAAVRLAGLDPYPGFLHSMEYGRHSLPLDLVEEFRAILADTLTLSLFNLGVIKANDFFEIPPPEQPWEESDGDGTINDACNDRIGRMTVPDDEEMFDLPEQRLEETPEVEESRAGKAAVRLHPSAFSRVVQTFEKKIGTEFFYPPAEKRLTYSDAMVYQARQFRRVIEGESAEYQPLLLK
jgi:CRISPR-associated protein Cas1